MRTWIVALLLLLASVVGAQDTQFQYTAWKWDATFDSTKGDCVYVPLGDLVDTGMGLFSHYLWADSLKASTVLDSFNLRYKLCVDGGEALSNCIYVPGAVSAWLWCEYRTPGGGWTRFDSTHTALLPRNRSPKSGKVQFRFPDIGGYNIPGVLLWIGHTGGKDLTDTFLSTDSSKVYLRTDTD